MGTLNGFKVPHIPIRLVLFIPPLHNLSHLLRGDFVVIFVFSTTIEVTWQVNFSYSSLVHFNTGIDLVTQGA